MSQFFLDKSGSGVDGILTINDIGPDGDGNFDIVAGSGITITPGTNQIIIDATLDGAIKTITGNSGGAQSPDVSENFNIVGSGSITTVGTANTETVQLTGLTQYNVLVGSGTDTIAKVAPSANVNVPLVSNGSNANPSFSGLLDNTVIGSVAPANAQFYTPVNVQTGTTYTLVSTDDAKLITANNNSAQTYTLPQQSTLTTPVGYWVWIRNIGTGTVTLVKEGSETLTGNTTLAPGAQAYIYRNTTTNWSVFAGTAIVNMPSSNTLIQAVSNVTYTLVGYAGNAGTLLGVYQKARSVGTAGTFNIQINGVNVTSLTSLVPSTGGGYTAATGANTFARGDQITIVYTATSAVLDHTITLDFTQAF